MGHATDRTASVHYGKKPKRKGPGVLIKQTDGLVMPLPSDVARVKEVLVATINKDSSPVRQLGPDSN